MSTDDISFTPSYRGDLGYDSEIDDTAGYRRHLITLRSSELVSFYEAIHHAYELWRAALMRKRQHEAKGGAALQSLDEARNVPHRTMINMAQSLIQLTLDPCLDILTDVQFVIYRGPINSPTTPDLYRSYTFRAKKRRSGYNEEAEFIDYVFRIPA